MYGTMYLTARCVSSSNIYVNMNGKIHNFKLRISKPYVSFSLVETKSSEFST